MPLHYRNVLPLVAVCLALTVASASAAEKAAPTVTTVLGNAPVPSATINTHDCPTGQYQGPIAFSAQFVFPPNDEYHTLLDPTGCCVFAGSTELRTAHARLNWPSNCQIPVTVTILGATGPSNCLVPDPNIIICPPTLYIIDGAAGGFIQHDFPLPYRCCIEGPAFLKIEFVSNGSCPPDPSGLDAPRLLGDNTPDPCVSYNYYPGNPMFVDLTSVFPGNPIMWADGMCGCPTPTMPSTWGSVKSIYR